MPATVLVGEKSCAPRSQTSSAVYVDMPFSLSPAVPVRGFDAVIDEVDHLAVLRSQAFEDRDGANLFHGTARALVLLADVEPDGIDVRRGVLDEQPLHFEVGAAAPVLARQEGVADRDFAGSKAPTRSSASHR